MCSSKGNLKRNNCQNDIMLKSFQTGTVLTRFSGGSVPILNWLLKAGHAVLFS